MSPSSTADPSTPGCPTSARLATSRRRLLTSTALGVGLASLPAAAPRLVGGGVARAGAPAIVKPLPAARFVDFGTNAEMRWDSVDPHAYLTSQPDLFVRDHTATPRLDAAGYALQVFGDGLREPRAADAAVSLSYAELRAMRPTRLTTVHECTGNGRSFFATQQGTPTPGTQWTLGAVGAVEWEGVRLADVLRRIGLDPGALSIQATGLDAPYVSGGVDYGRVRRPFPVAKALDDALLAWGADGADLLPDHGYPLRLVLPGWVGIASIKWLGSLEVSRTQLHSPWDTKWYRMTGGDYPADSPPLTVNPVRSALELAWGARLAARPVVTLTGRSWSGVGPIDRVDVSTDEGATWQAARIVRGGRREAWTQWAFDWRRPTRGDHTVWARATDVAGRQQPLVSRYNDNGYFFDAVVHHPVTIV